MIRIGSSSAETLERARAGLIELLLDELGEPAVRVRVRHELRYRGQSFELPVDEERDPAGPAPALGPQELRRAFGRAHEARYGYHDEEAEVELVNIRASAWAAAPELRRARAAEMPGESRTTPVIFAGEPVQARLFAGLPAAGTALEGPALCALAGSTLLIPPGWDGEVDGDGTIRLTRREGD